MSVFISLLRGINVGGHKKLKMASLKGLYESLGLHQTQTVLQSGNAIFRADSTEARAIVSQIEDGILQHFGFESRVILRTPEQLMTITADPVFSIEERETPNRCLVMFTEQPPMPDTVSGFLQAHKGSEIVRFRGDEVYAYYPNGAGQSKLSNNALEKSLNITGTARNWNTINRLADLVRAFEAP